MVPTIFGKIHFLLISERKFFPEIKCYGMTSFMEFINYATPEWYFWSVALGGQWQESRAKWVLPSLFLHQTGPCKMIRVKFLLTTSA